MPTAEPGAATGTAKPSTAASGPRPEPIADPLLEVRDLVKHFPITRGPLKRVTGHVRAVDGVSFSLGRGETYGLVGESGSGKSTVARLVLRLLEPTSGEIVFDGTELTRLRSRSLKRTRRDVQIVFQDPFSAFDPRMTISEVIGEPLTAHGLVGGRAARARAGELLELVGLPPGDLDKYPHQFSGGQAQRIGIARALATSPRLLVCDEAVSALDVSVQAQVLNLLRELQRELGLSYLFIAHDLNVVRYVSDRIGVMYLGRIVEQGPADELLTAPRHPYTRSLAAAIASADPYARQRTVLARGEAPSPSDPPPGCHFHTRCPWAFGPCGQRVPPLREAGPDRLAACHLLDLPAANQPDEVSAGA